MHAYADTIGVFVTRTGALGFRCQCGYLAFGRTREALDQAVFEHQAAPFCPAWMAYEEALAEDDA